MLLDTAGAEALALRSLKERGKDPPLVLVGIINGYIQQRPNKPPKNWKVHEIKKCWKHFFNKVLHPSDQTVCLLLTSRYQVHLPMTCTQLYDCYPNCALIMVDEKL